VTTTIQLDEKFFKDHIDEHARFDLAVRRHLQPDHVVLDAGAGRGTSFAHAYKEIAEVVVGLDRDPGIKENPLLHHAVRGDLARLPFGDATFHLVLAKYVFEHLELPHRAFAELRRVMKPGGFLVFHTPNRFHYFALVAKLTPHRFHGWFRQRMGAEAHDFDTFYRANDRRILQSLAHGTGFRILELELFEPKPWYLSFHPFAYRLGIAYERLVDRFDHLEGLRANFIGVLQAA
jgi:SAM-dependent methyltransferase